MQKGRLQTSQFCKAAHARELLAGLERKYVGAVDLCYRRQPFTSERQRVEYLFGLYEQLTAPLLPAAKPKRATRKKAVYAKPPRTPGHPSLTPEQAQADAAHFYSAKEEPPPYRA